jgi:hypothetical protein
MIEFDAKIAKKKEEALLRVKAAFDNLELTDEQLYNFKQKIMALKTIGLEAYEERI